MNKSLLFVGAIIALEGLGMAILLTLTTPK
jgi:hypothetical protein